MTAVTSPVRMPRLRLGGLTWVSWRQHRTALVAVAGLLGIAAALLLVHGHRMHADYHRFGLDACPTLRSAACGTAADFFTHRYQSLVDFLPGLFTFLPGLLGAFTGGPLIARELETGTFRFAWTQGTDRTKWVVAKLLLVGGVLLVPATLFTIVFTWWFDPWIRFNGRMNSGQAYEIEGTVFIARTLFAFTLGAFLGVIIKRTVPAVAATLGLWFGSVFLSVIYLRPLIQAPVIGPTTSQGPIGDRWVISDWFQDRTGHHLSDNDLNALLGAQGRPPATQSIDDVLRGHGIVQMQKYQPGSRFWHFQLVETLGYVVVALLLGVATTWWVRRRTS
jgi:hypothetical protein